MESFKIRFKFQKLNEFKYLSHLDIVRLLIFSIRRAEIPVKYSEGFNPNPKINFSFPIPVGLASFAEYADIELEQEMNSEKFRIEINGNLKPGFYVTKAAMLKEKVPSLMADISVIKYNFDFYVSDYQLLNHFNEEIDSLKNDLNSIWKFKLKTFDNDPYIVKLILFGYTKVLNNNRIFKFNDFLINLKLLSSNKNAELKEFFKEEAYVIRGGILKTPMDIV